MSIPQRFSRALSAFDHAARRWTVVPLRPPAPSDSSAEASSSFWPADRRIVGEQLVLTSWNIQAVQSKRAERSRRILDSILDARGKSPDIIFLQEVASDVRQSVLDDPRVRARFLTTDAEDDTAFAHLPAFATMTLLSKERFAASPSLAEEHGSKGAARAVEGRGPSSARRGGTCTCTCTSPYSDRAPTAPCPTRRALPFDFDGGDGCARRLRSWLGWLMLLWSSTGSHLVCVRARARAYLWRMHLCSRSERLHDARCASSARTTTSGRAQSRCAAYPNGHCPAAEAGGTAAAAPLLHSMVLGIAAPNARMAVRFVSEKIAAWFSLPFAAAWLSVALDPYSVVQHLQRGLV